MNIKLFLGTVATACLPLAATAQDWSGPYAGGSMALGMSEMEVFDSDEYTMYGYGRVDGFTAALSGRAGYNFQVGNLVYGPEVTLGVSTFDESKEFDFCNPTTVSSEISGIATLRGKIGFAMDNVMIFGSAGAAYLQGDSVAQCDTDYTDSVDDAVAFAASIGAEYMHTDELSVTFEYMAIRGDDEEVEASDNPGGGDIFTFSTDADLFSVGVNYHFN